MRNLKEILDEVHEKASNDNCQSWNVICQLAMEQAIKENTMDIISKLESLSNRYEVIDDCYVIYKHTLDVFTQNLESELP